MGEGPQNYSERYGCNGCDLLSARVVQLEDAIREHRETLDSGVTLVRGPDLQLWGVLDDQEATCTHESVDTFASGAGRRVDVCMACNRALRFWTDLEATHG